MVELPAPQLALPRFKPVPKPRPLTKWQKFAKEKGITKKKQSKLVYDDNAQDWKRRHGYKRGKDEAAVPVIEASDKDAVRSRLCLVALYMPCPPCSGRIVAYAACTRLASC